MKPGEAGVVEEMNESGNVTNGCRVERVMMMWEFGLDFGSALRQCCQIGFFG